MQRPCPQAPLAVDEVNSSVFDHYGGDETQFGVTFVRREKVTSQPRGRICAIVKRKVSGGHLGIKAEWPHRFLFRLNRDVWADQSESSNFVIESTQWGS